MSLSGGGSSAPTSQTVTQTNLPEYAQPYFENVLQRGQAESYREYTPYEGQRLAGFTPGEQQVQQEIMGMQTPGQFGTATQMAGAAGVGAGEQAQVALTFGGQGAYYGDIAAGVGQSATNYGAMGAGIGQAGSGAATRLGQRAATAGQEYRQMATDPRAQQAYMSPYMQNVVDAQKSEAIRDAEKAQLAGDLGAARRGTYGGARQLLAQTERERNLGSQLAQIQATGSQKAFEAAQQAQQFGSELGLRGVDTGIRGTDVAGQLGLGGARTGLAGVEGALQGYRTGIEGQRTGLAGVEGALAGYRTGLEGARTSLQGMQQMGQAGATLGQLGTAEQEAEMRRLGLQGQVGAGQRGLEQQRMDLDYGDFLRQRDYPMEQLGYFSNLLRGLPVGLNSSQTAYAAPPSAMQQLSGLGLAGLGIYNLGR